MHTKETTRSRDLIKKHRKIISEMYLSGNNQFTIADELNISRSLVAYDLGIIRKQWLETTLDNFGELKALELAKLDRLEVESWKAWESSKTEKEVKYQEFTGAKGEDGKPQVSKVSIRKELQAGDPKYLVVIGGCIKKRCEILGLDAPKKQAITDKDGEDVVKEVNVNWNIVKAEEE